LQASGQDVLAVFVCVMTNAASRHCIPPAARKPLARAVSSWLSSGTAARAGFLAARAVVDVSVGRLNNAGAALIRGMTAM